MRSTNFPFILTSFRRLGSFLLAIVSWLLLSYAPSARAAEEPGIYCFIVGVSNVRPWPLKGADELADRFELKIRRIFPEAKVEKLTSLGLEKPTWEALDRIMHDIIPQLPRYSSIIFYFAGHGERDTRNPEYDGDLHLLLEGASLTEHHRKSLRVAELYDAVARTRMINGLFFFDCCYSGTIIDPKTRTGRLFGSGDADLENTRRFLFFTATSNGQQATLGTFTERLLSSWEAESKINMCLSPEQLAAAVIKIYDQKPERGLQAPSLMPDLRTDWCLSYFGKPMTMLLITPKKRFDGAPLLTVGESQRSFKFSVAPHVAVWMVPKTDRLTVKVGSGLSEGTLELNRQDFKRDIIVLETDGKSIARVTKADPNRAGLSASSMTQMAYFARAEIGIVENSAEFFSNTARLIVGMSDASENDQSSALSFYAQAAAVTPGEMGRLMTIVAEGEGTELLSVAQRSGSIESQIQMFEDFSRFHGPAASLPVWNDVFKASNDPDFRGYAAARALADALAVGNREQEFILTSALSSYLASAPVSIKSQLLGKKGRELLVTLNTSDFSQWKAEIASSLGKNRPPLILPTNIDGDSGSMYASSDPVRVGVLLSLTGTMAMSDSSLRDALFFAFDEINAKGGILGRKIEPVVMDGASNWSLFTENAKKLIERDGVYVTFGCSNSASRRSVLPILEKNNALLFYSSQDVGEEASNNIFYTADAINQQAIQAVDYYLSKGKVKFFLLGSDYRFSQNTNTIILEYLLSKGIPQDNIGGGFRKDENGKILSVGRYTPWEHTDYQQIVSEIKQLASSGDACVISTLYGETNVPFLQQYEKSGLTSKICPVVSLSISENELRELPTSPFVGQFACWSYFQSLDTPSNKRFVSTLRSWKGSGANLGVVPNDRVATALMVNSYIGAFLWKAAVERAGSFDVDRVRTAWQSGLSFDGPGGKVTTQKNMHLTKNVYIGEAKADGQFRILKSFNNVYGEPFLKGKFK